MAAQTDWAGTNILVVEDEYMLASDIAEVVEGAGATVIGPVNTLANGVALIETGPRIHAAVLDVDLRGERVYPLADKLLERNVPILLVTGFSAEMLGPRYAGLAHCLKPIRPEDVRRRLAALMGR